MEHGQTEAEPGDEQGRRKKIETGLSEEIESHLAMATEANIAGAMSPDEARCAALLEFGGVEQIKERWRDERQNGCSRKRIPAGGPWQSEPLIHANGH